MNNEGKKNDTVARSDRELYDFLVSEFKMFYDVNLTRLWKAHLLAEEAATEPATAPRVYCPVCRGRCRRNPDLSNSGQIYFCLVCGSRNREIKDAAPEA